MIEYRSELTGIAATDLDGFFEGWPTTPLPADLLRVLGDSAHRFLALDRDRVVGFVYAISDGLFSAYIPLLEVRSSHRGQGIGTELVRRLLSGLSDLYMVDVVCDPDLADFYERFGLARLAGMAWRNPAAEVVRPH